MRIAVTSLLILLISSQLAFSQEKTVTYLYDAGSQTNDKVIDIKHLDAVLAINPYDTSVTASVNFSFVSMARSVDSIVFWAPDIVFDEVSIPGIRTSYVKKDDKLVIYILPGEKIVTENTYEIRMKYLSHPKYDLFFIGWNEPALRDNKQVWAHRPFHWLPYYEDRLTVDMKVTFDSRYKVMSNGVRVSVKENPDGTNTWHYRMNREHPFFSTCLVIGDYKFLEWQTENGLPLELWYYAWQDDHAEPTYRYTPQMFDFFNEEFGYDYPYEQYREAPVADYLYGAMETTTATVFGDYLAVDERAFDGRNYVNVNAHELAHQWFGNCLSHQKSCDVWLTESFATYYAKLFEREVFGDDYYQWVRTFELDDALEASKKDFYPVGHSRGGRARWYPKGSLVLDMLRDVLGNEGFKASIKNYTNKHAFSEVETSELLASVYQATGQSMDWFFDQWISRGGEPFYIVDWHRGKAPDGSDQTVINVKQAHDCNELTGLFKMPIIFEVFYEDGSFERKTQWIEDEFTQVIINNPKELDVSFVLFDPGRKVLKTVSFTRSFRELSAQALNAPNMIDRYDALIAMRGYSAEEKESTLLKAWENETFQLTRIEVLKQLFEHYNPACDQIYLEAIHDSDPLLRRAALENSDVLADNMKPETEKLLYDKSYIVVEKALELLARSFPHDIPRYLEATKNETGWRGMNIRMKWLEIALQVEQREYLGEIVDYCGPVYEFETRINAFQLLKRLNYLDKKAAKYLIEGYLYWNYKVSNAAKEGLTYFYQQNRYKYLIDSAVEGSGLSDEQKEKVEKLLAGNI